jgi:hypothetical protein
LENALQIGAQLFRGIEQDWDHAERARWREILIPVVDEERAARIGLRDRQSARIEPLGWLPNPEPAG